MSVPAYPRSRARGQRRRRRRRPRIPSQPAAALRPARGASLARITRAQHAASAGRLLASSVGLRVAASPASRQPPRAALPWFIRGGGRRRAEVVRAERRPGPDGRAATTPRSVHGFDDAHLAQLRPMLRQLLGAVPPDPVAWFYTRWRCRCSNRLRVSRVVYDCMDELSAFLSAPDRSCSADARCCGRRTWCSPAASASTVQAGIAPGRALLPEFGRCRALRGRASRRAPHRAAPRLLRGDRRADRPRTARCARRRASQMEIEMVGPVVKIVGTACHDVTTWPIEGVVARSCRDSWPAGTSACCRSRSTGDAFISPTKTPRYMAAGNDRRHAGAGPVESPWRPGADRSSAAGFVAACEAALKKPSDAGVAAARCAGVASTSGMQPRSACRNCSRRRCAPRRPPRGRRGTVATGAGEGGGVSRRVASRREHRRNRGRTAPAGGGRVAPRARWPGQRCRARLRRDRDRRAGRPASAPRITLAPAACCSDCHGRRLVPLDPRRRFTFDHAGHIMFSNDAYVHQMYRRLLGDNVHWRDREAWICGGPYPLSRSRVRCTGCRPRC